MVAILTLEQKELLTGQLYTARSYFMPRLDINDNWTITSEEIRDCDNELFNWVKNLELTEYLPKPFDLI